MSLGSKGINGTLLRNKEGQGAVGMGRCFCDGRMSAKVCSAIGLLLLGIWNVLHRGSGEWKISMGWASEFMAVE